jgi:hypothetical protein
MTDPRAREAFDALGLLAEMNMASTQYTFLLGYDCEREEYVVWRMWVGASGHGDEIAFDPSAAGAIYAAYETGKEEL